ncbi:MAG: cyclic-di-AMP receptor [Bacillota bacterium]
MKLVVTVVQDKDAPDLLQALVDTGYRATKLSSTGGFLREGNTTLLIGCESGAVGEVLDTIKQVCRTREQTVTPLTPISGSTGESYVPYPVEVTVGGATVFVLDVERFVQI